MVHDAMPDTEQALRDTRERTLALVAHLPDAELEFQVHPLMSPLVWDLAHIAAYEDLWLCHRHGGEPLLHPDLAATYDAVETPRAVRGEIELLDADGARDYLAAVRERTLAAIDARGVDPVMNEIDIRHEHQHTETMRQAMNLGGLLPPGEPPSGPVDAQDGWVALPAGPFTLGAGAEGFAYDNERPAHRVDLAAFRIARRPVTNGSWLNFAEGGGLERREWWTDEGWAWKECYDDVDCPGARAGHPDAPATHLTWFEADAFARAHRARLPTEAEWERASTWRHPDGGAALLGTGRVWEWTASEFTGYPGFVAHPYREYSEVFFDRGHRVLRGGSWATHPRVAAPTFRNWDLPQRRQIFAGVRLARDEEA